MPPLPVYHDLYPQLQYWNCIWIYTTFFGLTGYDSLLLQKVQVSECNPTLYVMASQQPLKVVCEMKFEIVCMDNVFLI